MDIIYGTLASTEEEDLSLRITQIMLCFSTGLSTFSKANILRTDNYITGKCKIYLLRYLWWKYTVITRFQALKKKNLLVLLSHWRNSGTRFSSIFLLKNRFRQLFCFHEDILSPSSKIACPHSHWLRGHTICSLDKGVFFF